MTPVSAARFNGLLGFLSSTPTYVSYEAAAAGARRLAARLTQLLNADELNAAAFVPIPRGGLIVLGLLAYVLDLPPAQFPPTVGARDPVIVVDDCALSGARFARTLAALPASSVVFATLYAPAVLRERIEAAEPRVRACVSAFDLPDLTPAVIDGEPREDWERRWLERLEGKRYWFGRPQPLAFAWGEPDRVFWNPATSEVESGWLFTPPHRCLRNRALLAQPLGRTALAGPVGPLRVVQGVVVGNFEDEVLLCRLPEERVAGLRESGADFFRALATTGDAQKAAEVLASRYEAPLETLQRDVMAFADTLLADGWLVQATSASPENA